MADKERKKPLTDDQVKAIVTAELANCGGSSTSDLSNERTLNLDYYFGRPFGNEQDGRSTVVDSSVRDTVEWIMPILMRIFYSGEEIAQFEPQGPEDVDAAEQATDYVDYIWNRDNKGFLNLYTWIKDGLLQKNGVVKIWVDDSEKVSRQRFNGLDDEAFAKIVNDKSVKVSEHTETAEKVVDPMTGQETEIALHDLVITRTEPNFRIAVKGIPPEHFLLTSNATSIDGARLAGHKERVTISDLKAEGVPYDILCNITGDDGDAVTSPEELARDTVESPLGQEGQPTDPTMREVWRSECYVKMDYDGDGIAEMRKVTVAGNGNTILSNEAWDSPRPFADLTPIILPHRRNGLALADLIRDLQLIKSTILRQYLDNLYLRNNQREEVVESSIIEPSEVLSSKPGMKIRVKTAGSINPILVPDVGQGALAGLEYIDKMREERTGVSERTQGLSENALHDTAQGERMIMNAAMGKIELIARTIAETGLKDAFRLILKLVVMYQPKERVVRLKNKWVPMDPRQWNSDMDMTVSVGVGTGDKEMQLRHAMLLGQMQEKAGQLIPGSVTPENFMATAEIVINSMGFKGVERFFTMPDPNAPKPPSPEMAKVQAQAEAEKAKAQMNAQMSAQQMQMEGQMKSVQMAQDGQLKQMQMQAELELKAKIAEAELQMKREQLGAELQLKREQMAAEMALKSRQMDYQASMSSDIGNVAVGGDPG